MFPLFFFPSLTLSFLAQYLQAWGKQAILPLLDEMFKAKEIKSICYKLYTYISLGIREIMAITNQRTNIFIRKLLKITLEKNVMDI